MGVKKGGPKRVIFGPFLVPKNPEKPPKLHRENTPFSKGVVFSMDSHMWFCTSSHGGGGEGGQTTLKQGGGISKNRSVLRGGGTLGVGFWGFSGSGGIWGFWGVLGLWVLIVVLLLTL